MSLMKDTAEIEAWESGKLGRSEEFVRKSSNDGGKLDDKLGLQMISIRLQKSLIEDLKDLAELNGIGYQPLMKQILKRFVDAEKKKILREMAVEQRNMEVELKKEAM
ncbi:hypothetical protein VHA01S_004_00480 [Vibrio halioticoli NBRC 102217]|uniref:Uncharacterized protein n=1 Tax=Vibrio halioticoli NBRC 102217 TaxID=1219072 RepID=V5EZM2_9VIBR|nr:hypothetical protein [Vibrio halioticoli]GAD88274.1 hypothetical protein VHA01S_004_00480 [Vibrio halioticoli NBRC 102217]